MALHGPVKVNDEVIGYWSAQRLTPLKDPTLPDAEVHQYKCSYEWPQPIFGYNDRVEFKVKHRYGDGAEALLIRVIEEAATRRFVKHATDGGTTKV